MQKNTWPQREQALEVLSKEVGYVRKPHAGRLRIALAFPNTYFARVETVEPKGKMNNMPVVTNEVKMMLGLADANASAAPPAPRRRRRGS